MEMSKVKQCGAEECAYNSDKRCHALAITIGDGPLRPMCDTFCMSSVKGGDGTIVAGIGACKVSECMFNSALECQSPEVMMGPRGNEIDCLTFTLQ